MDGDDTDETVLQAAHGVSKIHARPTAAGYALEVKSEPTIITGTHFGIEATVDAEPSASDAASGIRGIGAIGRLSSGYTKTGGSLLGGYSQATNLGTINGSGVMVAGHYTLLGSGGTYTAVSHIASLWVDSQLAQTITSGIADMVYISNNGSTTFNDAFYIYAGNKITNLMTISTASGMVGANNAGDATFSNWKAIKIDLDGTTHYLIAAQAIS